MRGSDALRTCMLGLVLVNLLFVQLTEAAALGWLLPLYGLTLLVPVLHPLRKWGAYRAAWNLAVIGVFIVLVRHAAGNDLRFVLQDGLVLAALCQVHLLNNLGRDQRPDLLFLNSFLIAVATGYLCQDLAYPAAFLVYVPLFIVGLQLLSLTRDGYELEPAGTRRIFIDGLWRSGVLLVLTLLVFLFWPRDFHRPSFLEGELGFITSGEAAEIGFSEELELRRRGAARVSDRVVMSATLLQGAIRDVPTLWRGATLDSTDGHGWWSSADGDFARGTNIEDEWVQHGAQLVRATAGDRFDTRLSVDLVDLEADRLFAPLVAERIVPGRGVETHRIRRGSDGVLTLRNRSEARTSTQFEIAFSAGRAELGGAIPERLAAPARYIALPLGRRVQAARDLAKRLASDLPEDTAQHEVVASFSDYLERRYAYLAPGAEGAAQSLDQFLRDAAGGHCETFAAALATMLRSRGIPCRVATGYRSAEWDPATGVLTFRSRSAHAWVEVYDPQAGWYNVDPNPVPAEQHGPGLWARTRVKFSDLWGKLAGFDSERRAAVLAWFRGLPSRSWLWARHNSRSAVLVALVLGLSMAFMRIRGKGMTPPDLLNYRRALRRAGLRRLPGETPRELLARTRTLDLPRKRWDAVLEATDAHELARYKGRPDAPFLRALDVIPFR